MLGIASGDRPVEFPAYGLPHEKRGERFAQSVDYFRQLLAGPSAPIHSPLGQLDGARLLPCPVTGRIPLLVTGSSRQSLQWLGEQADGWITYPEATHNILGPRRLAEKIRAWRAAIPGGGFRPHVTNEWIDLDENPDFPRTPLQGGYVLRTGRNGLIELLHEWREAGVNHAALGIQMAQRPVQEVIQELAEQVLPLFPSLAGPEAHAQNW
ncbi:Luciferase-like monooxygenase [compost metagenome]